MTTLIIALLFAATFILNSEIFAVFEINEYVSLVFIPSGVRIFSILVFEKIGAIGIFFGSLLISFAYLGQRDVELAICAAFVSGGSALLARMACMHFMRLDADFRAINFIQIAQISLVFSFISSVSHQLLYKLTAVSSSFLVETLYMFIGDLMGALVFLVFVKGATQLIKRFR